MKDLTLPTPALPKLPVSWATSEGMRHTPVGTHEFWGYVYGDRSIAAGADLYTADQMQDYARSAITKALEGKTK